MLKVSLFQHPEGLVTLSQRGADVSKEDFRNILPLGDTRDLIKYLLSFSVSQNRSVSRRLPVGVESDPGDTLVPKHLNRHDSEIVRQ